MCLTELHKKLPSSIVSRDFDKISGRGFESPNGVLQVSGRDVVGDHDVLWDDVSPILDDVIEDGTAPGAERVQLDCDRSLIQLQQFRWVRNIRFCQKIGTKIQ